MKRVLFVCIANPESGAKGDAKLIKERCRALERMAYCIDIMYFRFQGAYGCEIEIERGKDRVGVDIVIRMGLLDLVGGFLRCFEGIRGEPFQTWLSHAMYCAAKNRVHYAVSSYECVHFYHIRSIGLWKCAGLSQHCIVDLIDSYTLNLSTRAELEKNFFKALLIREELKRIKRTESSIGSYVRSTKNTVFITVSGKDLEYISGKGINKSVVPVGIQINESEMVRDRDYSRLDCIFFGNLDYEPNVIACKVLLGVMSRLIAEGLNKQISITVAGRNIDRRLRRDLCGLGIRVISPVKDMKSLVKSHNIAILPMFSGSGMQSKSLESIAWGCLVVGTQRAITPLGLMKGRDYIAVESEEAICTALSQILKGDWDTFSLRKNAFDHVKRFRWDDTCKQLTSLYKSDD